MPKYNKTLCSVNFAVVPRGNCTFAEKAYYAQLASPAGYQAIIVYNDPNQPPIPMAGGHKFADKVQIPVVMVTYACMESLLYKYNADKG
jgi:PA domain